MYLLLSTFVSPRSLEQNLIRDDYYVLDINQEDIVLVEKPKGSHHKLVPWHGLRMVLDIGYNLHTFQCLNRVIGGGEVLIPWPDMIPS